MSGSQMMVVLIVLIVSVAGILKARYRARHGIVEDHWGNQQLAQRPEDAGTNPEMMKELETLRERVKVLERIATDERQTRSIAAEIEALRDK
ncbi:hypothetical protein [Novosphingobium sp. TH158]|uniref:hypothetical protein n=1 Tax=Novosphingobium sp. TH158 TaxID=2067455 RepID=UPI000C7E09F2|nr:hypothetical protein [Novosphingobium sp. TH158]PLK26339.1 hypothetical protein C0V78_05185 [Novosphingobium sp. TH158]